jgi:hypothetical protein
MVLAPMGHLLAWAAVGPRAAIAAQQAFQVELDHDPGLAVGRRQKLLGERLFNTLEASAQRELLEPQRLLFKASAPTGGLLGVAHHERRHAEETADLLDREGPGLSEIPCVGGRLHITPPWP